MTDNELDSLIMASLERQQKIEALNDTIISDVRRRARREWIRRWGRIIVFSFGLPLVVMAFALGIYVAAMLTPTSWGRIVLVIPSAVMLFMVRRLTRNFSIADV